MNRVGVLALLLLLCAPLSATEKVRLHLQSGRRITGSVDARTDAETIWIYTASERAVLKSRWDWAEVRQVEWRGQLLTPEEFRELLPGLVSRPELPPPEVHLARWHYMPPDPGLPEAVTLQVDGQLASWDADAELDGFRLRVRPLSARDEVIPAPGHLNVQLRLVQRISSQTPLRNVLATQWSRRLQPDDFTGADYVLHLEFRDWQRIRQRALWERAELVVRLSVPGQGVLETVLPLP